MVDIYSSFDKSTTIIETEINKESSKTHSHASSKTSWPLFRSNSISEVMSLMLPTSRKSASSRDAISNSTKTKNHAVETHLRANSSHSNQGISAVSNPTKRTSAHGRSAVCENPINVYHNNTKAMTNVHNNLSCSKAMDKKIEHHEQLTPRLVNNSSNIGKSHAVTSCSSKAKEAPGLGKAYGGSNSVLKNSSSATSDGAGDYGNRHYLPSIASASGKANGTQGSCDSSKPGMPSGASEAQKSSGVAGLFSGLKSPFSSAPAMSSTSKGIGSTEKAQARKIVSTGSSGAAHSNADFHTQGNASSSTDTKSYAGGKLVCDRCDGKHLTEECPYFKKPRESHPDATRRKAGLGTVSTLPGATIRGGKVMRQPGDGSCLYHSLSYGLRNTNASSLRAEICNYIVKNPNMKISDTPISEWVKWDSGTSVQEYAKKMSRGAWGGGIEMAVVSKMKDVNVHVYEKTWSGGFKRISAFDVANDPASKNIVRVLYCGGVHYDALIA